ncbi:MAG: four helix bundle protein [Flavobacteriaceae bacterium]|nr:four helix bundle protein [Flavobacteriaceae bacterium]MDG2290237.1 four helix bundle protein [Flavobacteriaceae bacterium]
MSDIKTFEDLECWKKARRLRIKISELAKTFPNDEKFGLTSQIVRAIRSVSHNIAEGYGRFHFRENAQFCRTSRGSLYEVLDQVIVANEEGYITENVLKEIRKDILENIKILNGYINYLVKCAENKKG